MKSVRIAAFVVTIAAGTGTRALAQDFDLALSYSARETMNTSDNDVLRLNSGVSWGVGDGKMRAALELGVRNENFQGPYPSVTGAELQFARSVGNNRYGIGARIRDAEDLTTTSELAYTVEHFGSAITWRGMGGFQHLANTGHVQGRSQSSGFVQGEADLFLTDNWSVSAGLMADADGQIWGLGTEYRPSGWRTSLFLDWGHALTDYRGVSGYNDLTGGIRFIPRADTLRSFRRSNIARMMFRFVEVQ